MPNKILLVAGVATLNFTHYSAYITGGEAVNLILGESPIKTPLTSNLSVVRDPSLFLNGTLTENRTLIARMKTGFPNR